MAVTTDQDITGLIPSTGGTLDTWTFTGPTAFAAGTRAAPAIQLSDSGTGWYRSSSQNWSWATGDFAYVTINGNLRIASTSIYGWTSGESTSAADTSIGRAAANSVIFGAGSTATTTSRTELNKAVSAIGNAAATDVLTITIPNAAHSCSILVRVTGSLGAGGAIGANEASASNTYVITITRTAGVNAVAAISSAFGAAASAVAGAATVTCTAAVSAVSGAVGASNSFTVQATISRSGGSSTNHTCLVYAQLMNANVTGVTIA